MEPESVLIRALARALKNCPTPRATFANDAAAGAFFLSTVHDDKCPACGTDEVWWVDTRRVRCRRCRVRVGATAGTAFHGTRHPLSVIIAAIHALHVDTECHSARGFGRRFGLHPSSAWRLFHRVRAAIAHFRPATDGPTSTTAHRRRGTSVTVTHDDDSLYLSERVDAPASGVFHRRAPALVLGRFRAFLNATYCGVSRRHMSSYCAEFCDRFGRCRAFERRHHAALTSTRPMRA